MGPELWPELSLNKLNVTQVGSISAAFCVFRCCHYTLLQVQTSSNVILYLLMLFCLWSSVKQKNDLTLTVIFSDLSHWDVLPRGPGDRKWNTTKEGLYHCTYLLNYVNFTKTPSWFMNITTTLLRKAKSHMTLAGNFSSPKRTDNVLVSVELSSDWAA